MVTATSIKYFTDSTTAISNFPSASTDREHPRLSLQQPTLLAKNQPIPRGDGPLATHPTAKKLRDAHNKTSTMPGSKPTLKAYFQGHAGTRYDFRIDDIDGSSSFSGHFVGANFEEARAIPRQSFLNPVPAGCSFRGDFRGVVFRGAEIEYSSFHADLRGSDFRSCYCYEVNFGKSRLAGANFDTADLRGADLSQVPDLHLAKFGGDHPTLIDAKTKFPTAWTKNNGRGSILEHLLSTARLTYYQTDAHIHAGIDDH